MSIDESALDRLRQTLAADDYRLTVRGAGPQFEVRISAGPGACEDCLVPRGIMRGLLEGALGVPQGDIALIYPTDTAPDA